MTLFKLYTSRQITFTENQERKFQIEGFGELDFEK